MSAKTEQTSPPSGFQQLAGLGEAFQINFNTGQGVYSYKLALPEGVAGLSPKLTLEYSNANGHGIWGWGWRIALRQIIRRLSVSETEGITERLLDEGREIVPMADGSYRAQIEFAFDKYLPQDLGWKIQERSGVVHYLGTTQNSRVADPQNKSLIYQWLIKRTEDTCGNAIDYRYVIEGHTAYLAEIQYALYKIVLEYEDRPDPRSNGRMGFLSRLNKRCRRISVQLNEGNAFSTIRSWTFAYRTDPNTQLSILDRIHLKAHGAAPDGSEDIPMPLNQFQYTDFEPAKYTVRFIQNDQGTDPPSLTDPDARLLNLSAAPLPGILLHSNGHQHYWQNDGRGGWRGPRPVGKIPFVHNMVRSGVQLMDMNSSGWADLLVLGPNALNGYYENGGRQGWQRFVAYPRGNRTVPDWQAGVKVGDVNGNGKIDALQDVRRAFSVWENGSAAGWHHLEMVSKTAKGLESVSLDDPHILLADMTGDGLPDLVQIRSGGITYWPNIGRGRFGDPVRMQNSPRLHHLQRNQATIFLTDLSGTGCADLIYLDGHAFHIYLNQNGRRFSDGTTLSDIPPPLPASVQVLDFMGRGTKGILYNSAGSGRYVYLTLGADHPPYLLRKIENGYGLESEIRYRPAVEDYLRDEEEGLNWTTDFPFALTVTAGIREVDTVTGQTYEEEYRYHQGHYNYQLRQFQGFGKVERLEKGDESRPSQLKVYHYLMAQEKLPGNGPVHAHLNGQLQRTEIFGLDNSAQENKPFQTEESVFEVQELEAGASGEQRLRLSIRSYQAVTTERTEDRRVEEKTYEYDQFGNVTQERRRGYGTKNGIAQPERILTSHFQYAINTERWILNRLAKIGVRNGDGTLISEARRYYDGNEYEGLPLGAVERGLMTREEKMVWEKSPFDHHYAGMDHTVLGYHEDLNEDGIASVFINARRFAYNEQGLKTGERDSMGNTSSIGYDTAGLFKTQFTGLLGTNHYKIDYRTGQTTRITGFDGTEIRLRYDAMGRLTEVFTPDNQSNFPSRVYEYHHAGLPFKRVAKFYNTAGAGNYSKVTSYFDGRCKEVQHRYKLAANKYAVSQYLTKNPWHNTKIEQAPFFSTTEAFGIPSAADTAEKRFYYDAKGRPVRTVNFDGGDSMAQYFAFSTITTDPTDHDLSAENIAAGVANTPVEEEFDVFRNRTFTRYLLEGGNDSTTIQYLIDDRGKLTELRDDHGRLARYRYDLLGNRLEVHHREAGRRKVWFNANQKPVRGEDANGNIMESEYDQLNRITLLKANSVIQEQYVYDTASQNAAGRLAAVHYEEGHQRMFYDEAGRLFRREYHYADRAEPFSLQYEFDRIGRIKTIVHTEGTSIGYQYTPNGWIKSIDGIIDRIEYDPMGNPLQVHFTNQVVTTRTFTPGGIKVASQITRNKHNQTLENLSYEYNQRGQLLRLRDNSTAEEKVTEMAYDALSQLKTYKMTSPSDTLLDLRYEYSNHLDIQRMGEDSIMMDYLDPARPHRLTQLKNGPETTLLQYDNNGNLRNLPGRHFHYNFKNELTGVDRADGLSARYQYDHQGNRVSKTVDRGNGTSTTTYFVDKLAEYRNGQANFFIYLGHTRVGIILNGTVRYVHSDANGHTSCFSDPNGTKVGSIGYKPFGNLADSSGTVDYRTYGSHPYDEESGLYYMKRRYYAPEIGRFLTPDPIAVFMPQKVANNVRALHSYCYTGNDPVNNVDVNGLSFWSVFGAVVGVIVGVVVGVLLAPVIAAAFAAGFFIGMLAIIGLAIAGMGILSLAYMAADANQDNWFGEFMRGFMIGFNAGLNAAFGTALFGPVIGIALGVINFLAAFDSVAENDIYQGILGWSSWLMPMSWLATGPGLVIFLTNLVVAAFSDDPDLEINDITIDWQHGVINMEGGWIRGRGASPAFNMGNFSFFEVGALGVAEHESGHALNNAAFGSLFHYIGAIDQNVVGRGANAYSELLADSNDPNETPPGSLDLWSAPIPGTA